MRCEVDEPIAAGVPVPVLHGRAGEGLGGAGLNLRGSSGGTEGAVNRIKVRMTMISIDVPEPGRRRIHLRVRAFLALA